MHPPCQQLFRPESELSANVPSELSFRPVGLAKQSSPTVVPDPIRNVSMIADLFLPRNSRSRMNRSRWPVSAHARTFRANNSSNKPLPQRGTRVREPAVVRNFILQTEAGKPQPIQPLGQS